MKTINPQRGVRTATKTLVLIGGLVGAYIYRRQLLGYAKGVSTLVTGLFGDREGFTKDEIYSKRAGHQDRGITTTPEDLDRMSDMV